MDRSARILSEDFKISILPIIKASLKPISPIYAELLIANIGKGPATNIELEFSVLPGDFKRSWCSPLLLPGESQNFFLPEGGLEEVRKKYELILLKGTCFNILEEKITISDKIDLRGILDSWLESGMIYNEGTDQVIKRGVTQIERLNSSIRAIMAFGGGVLIKTSDDVKKEIDLLNKKQSGEAEKTIKDPKQKRE
jgi:hypothetical protein